MKPPKSRASTAAAGTGGAGGGPPRASAPPRPSSALKPPSGDGLKVTAEELATHQREISVSEFFTKNRHLLGFDNPTRALLTSVKEAVDNSLDACEEAGVLPDVEIKVQQLAEDRFRIAIEDNGPGIVKEQIGRIFGKLLYGSKFHRMKQSRGQQGIGISASVLYGQLTTGKPAVIVSRTGAKKPPHSFEVSIDTTKNEPIIREREQNGFEKPHGTRVEIELEARYIKGDKSVDEYVAQTALANPHARITYHPPGEPQPVVFDRAAKEMPRETKAIRPHPHGVELGILIKVLQSSKSRRLKGALQTEFSRVSPRVADDIIAKAGLEPTMNPHRAARDEVERLYQAIGQTKIMAPPTDCVSPIGEAALKKAIATNVKANFVTAVTRSPAVYRGNPFVVEAAIAYEVMGYAPEELANLARFANRVPLLYQPGACAITKAFVTTDWHNYGLSQSKGAPPTAPMLVMVHMASVWVPFTSEAKEAVAHYPEITKEIRLALQECGRQLLGYVRRRERAEYQSKRRSIFERYIEEVATSLNHLTKAPREALRQKLRRIASQITKAQEASGGQADA